MQNTPDPVSLKGPPIARYMALSVLTLICGILSGLLWLIPNGLMAGAMAFCYSLGTIWLAERERKSPGSVGLGEVLLAGLITGLLAVLPVGLLETTRPAPAGGELDFLRPPDLEPWYLITAPILFGVVMHFSYFQRKGARYPFSKAILTAYLLAAIVRGSLELSKHWDSGGSYSFPHPIEMIFGLFLYSLVMVLPFPLFWILVTMGLDPAWKAGRVHGSTAEANNSGSPGLPAESSDNAAKPV